MRNSLRATDLEYRYQTQFHLFVVGLAFLTYAFQPDDIVWAFIKHHTIYRSLMERLVFGVGTLMILVSAALQTWANAYQCSGLHPEEFSRPRQGPYGYDRYLLYFGRILFALGIGLLAPVSGTLILLAGEMALVSRLVMRDYDGLSSESFRSHTARVRRVIPYFCSASPSPGLQANWKEGLRKGAAKWGLGVTMIVFTVTLRDRFAEVLAGASFLIWIALNLSNLFRPNEVNK